MGNGNSCDANFDLYMQAVKIPESVEIIDLEKKEVIDYREKVLLGKNTRTITSTKQILNIY